MKKNLLVLLLSTVLCLSFAGCEKEKPAETKEINGKEWLEQQTDLDDEYMEISKATEDIYSLYIAGKMSPQDFLTELEITQKQLMYQYSKYKDEKDKIIIDPLSSEDSLEGIDALENLFTDMNNLYLASVDSAGVPYSVIEMSYIYMNYRDKIINDYANYKAALIVLNISVDSDISESKTSESEVEAK